MKHAHFATLFLLLAGCTARKTPAPTVAVAPTAVVTPMPLVVVAPPLVITTPTPDAETEARKAVVLREIAILKNASPEQDVAAAWAAKNTKFVALRGVGWHIPGVPKDRVMALLNKYDATPIEGMTDIMEFPEQSELGRLALNYAARYNQILLAKLDAQNTAKAD